LINVWGRLPGTRRSHRETSTLRRKVSEAFDRQEIFSTKWDGLIAQIKCYWSEIRAFLLFLKISRNQWDSIRARYKIIRRSYLSLQKNI
jgi:hypothetical protein